jgi:hypothetical protein
MSFLDEVRLKRKKLADVLSDEDYSGIRDIVEELYPDKAHFIYELLQNAEDTKATEVSFELTEKMLIFEHNGRPFNEDDVWGITNIGKGTKKDQDDKIGRFGVGFKAVFAYSETPHIWSSTFSFKITELVLPSAISDRPLPSNKTLFEFPFNNAKKPAEAAYEEVRGGLDELAETTLLFLSNLNVISWKIGQDLLGEVRRVQHSTNHIEVLKKAGKKIISRSHFLRFTAPVNDLPHQSVAIAFALDFLPNVKEYNKKVLLSKQLRVVPASQGHVAVFFPAEKENSGLRFHLHAPFVPELSRASIKETSANEPLFNQLAILAASSLHYVRDFKMLSVDFLGVLPNPLDNIPIRYQAIRKNIIEEMNTKPLTPTYTKTHAPAKNLLQAKASLKELLSVKDIEFLVDYEGVPPKWAVGASQKNSNQDRFLSGLAIQSWDFLQFLEMLQNKTLLGSDSSGPPNNITSEDVMNWLASKPVEWHQQMYSLLSNEIQGMASNLRNREMVRLKLRSIVRISDGTYKTGNECYFPSNGIEHDEFLPRVDVNVYSNGKSKTQSTDSRRLLVELGVSDVGEAEQVHAILKRSYNSEDFKPEIKDIERFVALVENEPGQAKIFADYYIFKRSDDKWGMPSQVYLDLPFVETGLAAYYDAVDNSLNKSLSNDYKNTSVPLDKLRKFAESVGVHTCLKVTETTCKNNPQYRYLVNVPGERWTSPINEDYEIEFIDKLFVSPTVELSRLVWRTMCNQPKRILKARYRKNESNGSRYGDSQLVHLLRKTAWVPQKNGTFVKPSTASRDQLPNGFAYDEGYEWLKAVNFGDEIIKLSEENQKKNASARELGFDDEKVLADAQWFAGLDPLDRQQFKDEVERKRNFELPDDSPRNPEHRADRVGQQATEAPGRETEKSQRSVSVGREDVKQEAAQYLSQQYTNNDGEMICQICKGPLPFKLADGSYYFEKVEFLTGLEKRHYQNYLTLCPNHSAMFQHTNGSKDIMSEKFQELSNNELDVILAQKDMGIYFTATHRADLHSVLNAVNGSEESQES